MRDVVLKFDAMIDTAHAMVVPANIGLGDQRKSQAGVVERARGAVA